MVCNWWLYCVSAWHGKQKQNWPSHCDVALVHVPQQASSKRNQKCKHPCYVLQARMAAKSIFPTGNSCWEQALSPTIALAECQMWAWNKWDKMMYNCDPGLIKRPGRHCSYYPTLLDRPQQAQTDWLTQYSSCQMAALRTRSFINWSQVASSEKMTCSLAVQMLREVR